MAKTTTQQTKTYLHFCAKCNKEFNTEQKMEACPLCGGFFKMVFEYFAGCSRVGRVYYQECENCKIRFETKYENQECFRCHQPSLNVGLSIGEPIPRGFWGSLLNIVKGLFC